MSIHTGMVTNQLSCESRVLMHSQVFVGKEKMEDELKLEVIPRHRFP
jgi:hypothetical protein